MTIDIEIPEWFLDNWGWFLLALPYLLIIPIARHDYRNGNLTEDSVKAGTPFGAFLIAPLFVPLWAIITLALNSGPVLEFLGRIFLIGIPKKENPQ